MGFKKLRGVNLSEEQQGLIRYTCLNYRDLTPTMQKKIERLCQECGGFYGAAIWEVMCTTESIVSISLRNHVSESSLYRMRTVHARLPAGHRCAGRARGTCGNV